MEPKHAAGWRRMEEIFTSMKNICKETRISIQTYSQSNKKELFRYGIKTDDECPYCGKHDSIGHTFNDREFVKNFVKYVVD